MHNRHPSCARGPHLLFLLLLGAAICLPRAAAAQEPVADSTARLQAARDTTGKEKADSGLADSAAARAATQRDVWDLVRAILGRKPRPAPPASAAPSRKLTKTILPIIGNNPTYGTYFGASLVLSGWLGDRATTSLTSGSLGAFHSTGGYNSIAFRSSIYMANNRSLWKGDWRYLDAAQATYGLGPATASSGKFPMRFFLYRVHQTYFRQTKTRGLYIGLGYFFDRWDQISDTLALLGVATPYVEYNNGTAPARTTSSGLSFEVVFDSRDNQINAGRGVYWNAALRSYHTWLGSDQDWQSLWNEVRLYLRLIRGSRGRLAIWNYMWMTFGRAPYLDLPANTWDVNGRASRGYIMGRIRGENQIYTEFEYRQPFTRDGLLGGVAFLNLMATTTQGERRFGQLDPGYGLGLRLKFDKRTGSNLTADYARDRYGNGHLYMSLQEAF